MHNDKPLFPLDLTIKQHVNLGCWSDDCVLITSCAACSSTVMLYLLYLDLCIASDCDSQILLQLQEFQERQKKIADMEAKLKDKDEEVATRQERIKELHVSNVASALTSLARKACSLCLTLHSVIIEPVHLSINWYGDGGIMPAAG